MDAQRLVALFKYFLQELPSLAAYSGCIVFAITRWKRYPKVAPVVTIALAFLLLHEIVFSFVYFFVPSYFIRSARYEDIQTVIRNVYLVIGLISNTIAAIGMIVLLTGIFMRRKPGAAN
jgi:hypothetical protein